MVLAGMGHAHAEGYKTVAGAYGAHTEGYQTFSTVGYQHVQGRLNKNFGPDEETRDSGPYAHVVGNGRVIYDENNNPISMTRSNAHTLDWNGNAWYTGNVYVGGTKQEEGKKLATEDYTYPKSEIDYKIDQKIASVNGGESAAYVKSALEDYRDAINSEIWGEDAKDWTTTSTTEDDKTVINYNPDYKRNSRIDNIETSLGNLGTAAFKDEQDFESQGAVEFLNKQLANVAKTGNAEDVIYQDTVGCFEILNPSHQFVVDNVEKAINNLSMHFVEGFLPKNYKISINESSSEDFSKQYIIKQGKEEIGKINVPKDMVLQSGDVITLTESDGSHEPGTYLKLILANSENSEIWISVKSLIEYVTSGSTDGDMVIINIDDKHQVTASITDNSITKNKLNKEIQETLDKTAGYKYNNGEIFNDYENNKILNDSEQNYYAHAEGCQTEAGWRSHSEGHLTLANNTSHAEGKLTKALGKGAHAEGYGGEGLALLNTSGNRIITIEETSIDNNTIIVNYDVSSLVSIGDALSLRPTEAITAEFAGIGDTDSRKVIAIESTDGKSTITFNTSFRDANYYEGHNCPENGKIPAGMFLAKSTFNIAYGVGSHAEGYNTKAGSDGITINSETGKLDIKTAAHAEGLTTIASGEGSHAEGNKTVASGFVAHAEGLTTTASGNNSHAEGQMTLAASIASHAEGQETKNYSKAGHTEGWKTQAGSPEISATDTSCAHAEGSNTKAYAFSSHAEGDGTTASGSRSHAEGATTTASGVAAHAEGYNTHAHGIYSHAEGWLTYAEKYAHAEGLSAEALGNASHAEGQGTIAQGAAQHVQGRWNDLLDDNYSHIVGNGTSNANRSNAHTLDWSGNAWFAGTIEATGIILTSPNGSKYKITIDNDGNFVSNKL